MSRASSHGIRSLLRNLLFATEKLGIAFFATFISNSRFFRLLFNFTIHKTIKSGDGKLTFIIQILSISGLM